MHPITHYGHPSKRTIAPTRVEITTIQKKQKAILPAIYQALAIIEHDNTTLGISFKFNRRDIAYFIFRVCNINPDPQYIQNFLTNETFPTNYPLNITQQTIHNAYKKLIGYDKYPSDYKADIKILLNNLQPYLNDTTTQTLQPPSPQSTTQPSQSQTPQKKKTHSFPTPTSTNHQNTQTAKPTETNTVATTNLTSTTNTQETKQSAATSNTRVGLASQNKSPEDYQRISKMFSDISKIEQTYRLIKTALIKSFQESTKTFNAQHMTLDGETIKGGIDITQYNTIRDDLCHHLNLQKESLSRQAKELLETRINKYETLFTFYT